MHQQEYKVLGLMSGTSLDGLDLCLVRFWKNKRKWLFEILKSDTLPYTTAWYEKLRTAHLVSATELLQLDHEYGLVLAAMVAEFIKKHAPHRVDFISSHGHTVLHQPDKKITLQIGNGPEIMKKTKLPVVCDFRKQDVLLGGQGAPLVPIGDLLLFADYTACVNLGGFANISFGGPNRIAFDICPVNIVCNALAEMLGKPYDAYGGIARSSVVNASVLHHLNSLAYYQQPPPKSLGREWLEKHINPYLERDTPQNLLATFTVHAAQQIAQTLQALPKGKVLFTGGGSFNTYLIDLIKKQVPQHTIILPEPELISQKEALIFAFLGVLRWEDLPNCLASVTGASRNHSSGRIYLPFPEFPKN